MKAIAALALSLSFMLPAGADDLRPAPTIAPVKQSFSVRHPRLWKIRQACRFMMPVLQVASDAAQITLPFLLR